MKISALLFILLTVNISFKTKEEWKSRSIYQILTDRFSRTSDIGEFNYSKYCGRNYKVLIEKLDFIKGMGFDAIGISPIVENLGDNYHGYALINLYNLNSHFGTEEDFISLISVCGLW